MSSVVETRPAGWRPDPSGRYEWRYWDGGWTNRVANSATPAKPPTKRAPAPTPPARHPVPGASTTHTAAPASDAEAAVMRAVAAGRGATPTKAAKTPAPKVSSAPPAYPPETRPAASAPRTGLWAAIVRFFRSFADQEESYHSPKAGAALAPHPKGNSILGHEPGNYGRAGLVALAACGLGIGAYLPWLSGTIGVSPFERTGVELGKAWGFTGLAVALALAAILGVRWRLFRWVNMGLAIVVAVLTAKELVNTHDLVTSMNAAAVVRADVGIGLWIMLASAGGALIASFRVSTPGG
ncbi:MAG TPA: hypothetical protein VH986_14395 [Acidimicrobiia bacterium]|jgi:hypothetical protein